MMVFTRNISRWITRMHPGVIWKEDKGLLCKVYSQRLNKWRLFVILHIEWWWQIGIFPLDLFCISLSFSLFPFSLGGMTWLLIYSLLACITVVFANDSQRLFLPNTYVVEFQQPYQDDLSQHLAEHKIEHHLRHRYDMMHAISLSFNTSNDATRFFHLMRQDIHRTWPVVCNAKAKYMNIDR